MNLHQFNQALAAQSLKPIKQPAFDALMARVKPGAIESVIEASQSGNRAAKQTLERYAVSAGLLGVLLELGLEGDPTIDDARALYMHINADRLRRAAGAALQGNANARSILAQWIESARAEATDNADIPEQPAGSTDTASQATQNTADRRYMPPPSALPTSQAHVTPLPTASTAQATAAAMPPPRNATAEQTGRAGHERSRQPDTAVATTGKARQYDEAKAYGNNAALTFNADETRSGVPTVTIEAAQILDRQARTYAWTDKTIFQLTDYELQLVTALLFQHIPELYLSGHADKWMSMTRQDDGAYAGTIKVTLGQGKAAEHKPRTVQIDPSSLGPIAALCLRRCTQMLKASAPTETFAVLRQVATAYLAKSNRSSANQGMRRAG